MDRNLALEFVRITEAAALACAEWTGHGDEKAADKAAVDAMRKAFDSVNIDGTVVIGEGERDEAPMLYIGEKVGNKAFNAPAIDIALDPLEGTTICATGGVGSVSVIAVAERGNFLHAPDTYMDKIACGPGAKGCIDIDKSATENVKRVAEALKKTVGDLTVVILDRPRHEALIAEVRKTGARIHLIGDGDVSAAIATGWADSGIDLLMGIGGAPEGVISAAAMQCLGGDFQGRLKFRNEHEKERATAMGIKDLTKKYTVDELAKGSVMFVATGVTDGPFLKGVKTLPGRQAKTHSVVMRSVTGTIRTIEAHHKLSQKPNYKTI
ncbi:MAG TPA: class II fructose-bisphosphatase [Pseudobdellovibrionaceae bacterium]|jgi:fructose-1,6-bisphosphatase II